MAARAIEPLAVVSADVAGLDRVRPEDAEAAAERHADRHAAIGRIIAEHHGSLLHTSEDTAIAASLPDASAAVRAALAIQEHIADENGSRPAHQHVQYGIGIDYGEVTIEDERVSGAVVDVARALQSIARPGAIVVSRAVFDQIKRHMRFVYRILERQQIADLPYLVEGYQIKQVASAERRFEPTRWLRRPTFGIAAAGALLLLVGSLWYGYQQFAASDEPRAPTANGSVPAPAENASPGRAAGSATEPDMASEATDPSDEPPVASPAQRPAAIAVLPFANASEDSEQAYFANGVTESLIRRLGRFPHLQVIAAETMFTYQGDAADPSAIGRELGAGYLLEGSAGRADGELRIEARLLDAGTGAPLWEEAYAARSNDPAAAQRALGERILATLEGREPVQIPDDTDASGTQSLQAYDYGLQWRELFNHFEASDNRRARQAALHAIELDPDYAAAYAYVAWTHMADYWRGWASDRQAALDQALEWATKAVRRDPDDFDAQWALGDVHQAMGRFETALGAYTRALDSNPNAADLMQDVGTWMLPVMGRAEDGLELAREAMRLNPHHAEADDGNIAFNYYLLERYEDAIEAVNGVQEPRFDHLLYLAASYAQLDQMQEARLVIATVLGGEPDLTVEGFLETLPLQRDADREHLRAGLEKAGLPLEGA